jgi:hypothetical protein
MSTDCRIKTHLLAMISNVILTYELARAWHGSCDYSVTAYSREFTTKAHFSPKILIFPILLSFPQSLHPYLWHRQHRGLVYYDHSKSHIISIKPLLYLSEEDSFLTANNHFVLQAVLDASSKLSSTSLQWELANYTIITSHKRTPEPAVMQLQKYVTIEMRVNLLHPKIYTGYVSGKIADFLKFTPHLKRTCLKLRDRLA